MVNADGTKLHVLPTGTHINSTPAFSPDRKKIAFGAQGGIFVANADGSNVINVISSRNVNLCASPKWIDNNTIYYASKVGGNSWFTIYRYDIIRKKEQMILDHVDSEYFSLSPDGRVLAFQSRSDQPDILVRDLLTKETYNLTNGNGKFVSHHPAWSPDGKKIAFASNRDGFSEIYIMDSDGKNVERVTHNRWTDTNPAWSPDGTKLVYVSERKGDPFGGGELFIMDLKEKKEWRLTRAVKDSNGFYSSDDDPSWVE